MAIYSTAIIIVIIIECIVVAWHTLCLFFIKKIAAKLRNENESLVWTFEKYNEDLYNALVEADIADIENV